MSEFKIKKGDQEIFSYETKENKNFNGKRMYKHYGLSKFAYQLIWTGLWFLFIFALCYMFSNASPLWLLIFWLMGSKW